VQPAQYSPNPSHDFPKIVLVRSVHNDYRRAVQVIRVIGFRKNPRHGNVIYHPDVLVLKELADVLQRGYSLVEACVSSSVGIARMEETHNGIKT